MMFTPRNQLANMISNAAAQAMCGNNIAENTARIIALQSQLELQNQRHQSDRSQFNRYADFL
jgi:hypothetical protein